MIDTSWTIQIDIVAPLNDGGMLFGECKWGSLDIDDLNRLKAKVAKLPYRAWQENPKCILFTAGDCTSRLRAIAAADPSVMVADGSMLF